MAIYHFQCNNCKKMSQKLKRDEQMEQCRSLEKEIDPIRRRYADTPDMDQIYCDFYEPM